MTAASAPNLQARLTTRIAAWDAAMELRASRHRGTGRDDVAQILSASADRAKLWVGVAGIRLITDRRNGRRAALRAVTCIVVGTTAVDLAKGRFGRRRPANSITLRYGVRPQTSASFPSGHAVSAAMAAVLLSDRRPSWRLPLAAAALAVGWSRVQVGLHHSSDVAAGLMLGTAMGMVMRRVWPLRRPVTPESPAVSGV